MYTPVLGSSHWSFRALLHAGVKLDQLTSARITDIIPAEQGTFQGGSFPCCEWASKQSLMHFGKG